MDAMDEVYLKGTVPPCMELAAFNHWACVGLEYIMGNDADGKNQIRQLVEFLRIKSLYQDVVSVLLPPSNLN